MRIGPSILGRFRRWRRDLSEWYVAPMRFLSPLVEGRLVRRYKRFLADVELAGGEIVTVHCANPGSMIGLAEPGMRVFLSRSAKPDAQAPLVVGAGRGRRRPRRHQHRAPQPPGRGGDRRRHDRRARRLRAADRREVRYGRNSRIDILLGGAGRPDAYVEVKNVHLSRRQGLAEFPDSVDRARRQAPRRALRHGRRRPPRGDALPRPAQRHDRVRPRPRHRPGLRRRLRPRPRMPASKCSPTTAASRSTKSLVRRQIADRWSDPAARLRYRGESGHILAIERRGRS